MLRSLLIGRSLERLLLETVFTASMPLCLLGLTACGGGSGSVATPSNITISGTITGLGNHSGLVLLNNGADATAIGANATTFTMHTAAPYGSAYAITVGTQPYGVSLACTVSAGVGTARTAVTSVAVNCTTVTPAQKAVVGYFTGVTDVAADATGNVFVTEYRNNTLKLIAYSDGSYGVPVPLSSDFNGPSDVAVDTAGDVFVNDSGGGAVKEIPFSNGSYGAPITLASGFTPASLVVDTAGDVFVADRSNNEVKEIPFSNGSYGAPILIGSGFNAPSVVSVDASGDVYVAEYSNNVVEKIPFSNGSYGAPITIIASGIVSLAGVAVDSTGDVFVADAGNQSTNSGTVEEIPFSNGSYQAPITLWIGFTRPDDIVVDTAGNVLVADTGNYAVKEIPFNNGSYRTPYAIATDIYATPVSMRLNAAGNLFVASDANTGVNSSYPVIEIRHFNDGEYPLTNGYGIETYLGSGLLDPAAVVVNAAGNLFVADTGNAAVKEIPFGNGSYGAPTLLAFGLGSLVDLRLDATGDVFVDLRGVLVIPTQQVIGSAIKEIPVNGGTFGSPVTLGSGFRLPNGIAIDAAGNLFVADTGNAAVKEIPFSNGSYGAPIVVSSNIVFPTAVALDRAGDLFVVDFGAVKEIPLSNGSYGMPVTIASGLSSPGCLAVDAAANVFIADTGNNAIQQIPFSNGSYGAPVQLASGFDAPACVAIDAMGRLYVVDVDDIWVLTP